MRARVVDALSWASVMGSGLGSGLALLEPTAVVLAGLATRSTTEPVPLALAALAALLVCRGADLHRWRLSLSVLEDLPALLLAAVSAALVLGALSSEVDLRHRLVDDVVPFAATAFAAMVLLRTAVYALTRALRHTGATARPVLIVGTGAVGRRLTDWLLVRRDHGLDPVGMLDSDQRDPGHLPVPMVGSLDDLDRVLSDLRVDDVIVALPDLVGQDPVDVVRRCVQHGRRVFVVPLDAELSALDRDRRPELVRDITLIRLHRVDGPRHAGLQRGIDVVVALGALVVLSPVLVAIALAVRLETGRGALVHQTRVSERGLTSTLLKFRSLRPAQFETHTTTWSIDNDGRTGPVGRFLRRTGLDELPQLVNVLRGELSLVGLRPGRRVVVAPPPPRAPVRPPPPPSPPVMHVDDLTSEHWSWWEDVRIARQSLGAAVSRRRRRGGFPRPGELTAPDGCPRVADTPARGRELHDLRRG